METTFKFIRQARKVFIELIDTLNLEQLNQIPSGYNNNIIWNFGHIIVATQGLCYIRTGVKPDYIIKYGSAYAKGSKPTYTVTQEEVDDLKVLALQTIEQIEADYNAGLFATITPYATDTYKETLFSIEEVIALTSGHDNFHFGYAVAQKRGINTK